MPTLGTLAASINTNSRRRRSEVYITELGDDDRPLVTAEGPQWRKFQYYPESVSDTKAVAYQPRDIPGGSLPLYQYTSSGERVIAFTARFSTDIDHFAVSQPPDAAFLSDAAALGDQPIALGGVRPSTIDAALERAYARLRAAGELERNPYIVGALVWLRRFVLPRYGESAELGVPLTKPPHKLLLHFAGAGIELCGGGGGFSAANGGILCVMTQCDINFTAFFPTGNVRRAEVSLAFAEVPQAGGAVRFPSAQPLDRWAEAWYKLTAKTPSTQGGSSSA